MVQLKNMTTMKKIYKTPITEQVQVRLNASVLDAGHIGSWSNGGDEYDSKQNDLFFEEDDDAFGDIWGTDEEPKDLWE